jgi:protoporphyrinogen oxidase
VPAGDWLVRQYGERTYRMLYAPLLESKFREHTSRISAAWMWARFYRLGNSRTVTQKERIGYLEGGSQAYIDALEQALRRRGVEIHTAVPVEPVVVESGKVVGVRRDGELLAFDQVLSTVPIPYTGELFADLEGPYFENLRRLKYIGVLVALLRIREPFSRYFWMNVSDPRLDISGIIEYTNLNPLPALGGDAILYIPQYLPATDPLYATPNEELIERYVAYLQIINPRFEREWVRQYWVHRDRFAQPICEMGFSARVPDIRTPIHGLFLTDSYQLHPHDRSISDSTELGRRAAAAILDLPVPRKAKVLTVA